MGARPDTIELLVAARRQLLEVVVPQFDGEARRDALMIGDALAITIRDLVAYPRPSIEAPTLEVIYPSIRFWSPEIVERFCQDVRMSRFDHRNQERTAAWQALKSYAKSELAIANPDYEDSLEYE
ncbi:MAG: hypothetical protein R3E60_02065 [Alphaproteobacteria bacterium]